MLEERDEPLVLIVDDAFALAEQLRTYLKDNGYRVAVANTVEDGWEDLHTLAPDILVVDLDLHEQGDGWGLVQRVLGEDEFRDMDIVLTCVESKRLQDIIDEVEEEGRIVGLAKPFEPETLLHAIRVMTGDPSEPAVFEQRGIVG